MSGGHFNYNQYHIQSIADEIEGIIDENRYDFSDETINRFAEGLTILKMAYIYTQRIDWLLSGDDGEEYFHRRLLQDTEESKILFLGVAKVKDFTQADKQARLIATAPELLEALEKLMRLVENNWLDQEWEPEEWECYDEFRKVIAKAKGTPDA
jgi:hypothetical protein